MKYDMVFPILNTIPGVAFANGEVWKEQRRMLMSVIKKADVDGIR